MFELIKGAAADCSRHKKGPEKDPFFYQLILLPCLQTVGRLFCRLGQCPPCSFYECGVKPVEQFEVIAVSSRFLRMMLDLKKGLRNYRLQHMNKFFYGGVPQTQGDRPVSAVFSITLHQTSLRASWPLGMFPSRGSFL